MTQDLVRCAQDVEAARQQVADATLAYHRGGSLDAVNAANRKLADAHAVYREVSGGRIPDRR